MIGVYDYTVLATYVSLAFGVSGILAAMNGRVSQALLCLAISGLLDAFDGRIARTKKNRTEQEKRFGIQIDSLNDVVCFGVLPGVIGASLGSGYEWWKNFYEFHKLAIDELEAFDYETYKKNGFHVNKLGDYPLKLEVKPD